MTVTNRMFITGLLLSLLLTHTSGLYAAGDLTTQKPAVVDIYLSDKTNKLQFYPSTLNFETGKLYKLNINNRSTQKHYFSAEGFSRSVFTRKVEIIDHKNKTIAEVKGHVNEIEVYPGGTAQWWFVPVKTLHASRLFCSIKGHAEAGMTGKINIK